METTYLVRYCRGEHAQVWDELTALGAVVREEPLYTAAREVAFETMRRARTNVELLLARLNTLGYRFASSGHTLWDTVWVPPTPETLDQLTAFDHQHGPLPLSVYAWHAVVGSVNFMGSHPHLSMYAGHRDQRGEPPYRGAYSDPLVIFPPLAECVEPYDAPDGNAWAARMLVVAPDDVHKAGLSGGPAFGVSIPNVAMDGRIISEGWAGESFLNYLRGYFTWGRFPGLQANRNPPHQELAFLTKDLLTL